MLNPTPAHIQWRRFSWRAPTNPSDKTWLNVVEKINKINASVDTNP